MPGITTSGASNTEAADGAIPSSSLAPATAEGVALLGRTVLVSARQAAAALDAADPVAAGPSWFRAADADADRARIENSTVIRRAGSGGGRLIFYRSRRESSTAQAAAITTNPENVPTLPKISWPIANSVE